MSPQKTRSLSGGILSGAADISTERSDVGLARSDGHGSLAQGTILSYQILSTTVQPQGKGTNIILP